MATTPWTSAKHTFDPDPTTKRCRSGWYNDQGKHILCRSTQRSSVLHDDPESDFRQLHWHGGGDCLCFEREDGPSYFQAMNDFIAAQGRN